MSLLKKVTNRLAVVRDAEGNLVEMALGSSGVYMPDGTTTLTDKLASDAAAQTAALDAAINLLKDGGDGTSLPADRDNLKKLADALGLLKGTVDTFLTGEPDAGTIDRLSELIAEIKANKDNIAAIVADNLKASDLVDSLTSTDATKPLAASQGKALKDLIDALQTSLNDQIASLHTHTNKAVLDAVTANHTLLASKVVTELPAEWPADVRTDGVLYLVNA